MKNDKARNKTRIAVYLIALQGQTILLSKRKNTEHMDGHWSLVAGHVYEGESCTRAMVREAQEECGLFLNANDLKLVGAMHHYSAPFDYTNFIFSVDLQGQQPKNLEPEKCDALEFYTIENLPSPMVQYVVEIIRKSMLTTHWISEFGWE